MGLIRYHKNIGKILSRESPLLPKYFPTTLPPSAQLPISKEIVGSAGAIDFGEAEEGETKWANLFDGVLDFVLPFIPSLLFSSFFFSL